MCNVDKQSLLNYWINKWETWDLRLVILFSLTLQIFLIFSAPLRKRTASPYIIMPMWLAYTMADATANFGVGLISKSQGDTSGPFAHPELVGFWAPFLLVHLGGPDTITAFALEDNELWLRHFLQLIFQCATAGYIFLITLSRNKLLIPTLMIFSVGFIKYLERTRSLYLASWRSFRDSLLKKPDPGPNYDKLMDEFFSEREVSLPVEIKFIEKPYAGEMSGNMKEQRKSKSDLDVVMNAFLFFEIFKRLLDDLVLSFDEREQSRKFFLKENAWYAFKIVEVELNFLYEILYTKARVLRGKTGYFFRFVSFFLNSVALGIFFCRSKKAYHKIDVGITYTLLLGPVVLDIVALSIDLFSHWTAANIGLCLGDQEVREVDRILKRCLNVNRERWPKVETVRHRLCTIGWFIEIGSRTWSESVSQMNLLHYCLHPRSEWIEKLIFDVGLTSVLDRSKYVKKEPFKNGLRDFIFDELKMKSEIADDLDTAKDICNSKGDWVLLVNDWTTLLPYIQNADFDESLIVWHIATDLCYGYDQNKRLLHIVTDPCADTNFDKKRKRLMIYAISPGSCRIICYIF